MKTKLEINVIPHYDTDVTFLRPPFYFVKKSTVGRNQ
jgi:hypothetical protein